jgi:hypothetical protein
MKGIEGLLDNTIFACHKSQCVELMHDSGYLKLFYYKPQRQSSEKKFWQCAFIDGVLAIGSYGELQSTACTSQIEDKFSSRIPLPLLEPQPYSWEKTCLVPLLYDDIIIRMTVLRLLCNRWFGLIWKE